MFNKILIANRGDPPRSGAATKSNRRARSVRRRLSHGATTFTKILIANRGDPPRSGAATKSNRRARAACAGD
jgi:hypothetical protein